MVFLLITFYLSRNFLIHTASTEYCEDSLIGHLPASSFSASSSYTNRQDEMMYGAGSAKIVTPGSWVAETVDQDQYLQVDLQRLSVVTEIITKGRSVDRTTGCCQQYVTGYFVQYSTNNRTWNTASSTSNINLFNGNTNTEDSVKNKLGCPAIARFVRILPQSWQGHIAMRVDIRGCYIQQDSLSQRQSNYENLFPQLRDSSSSRSNGNNQHTMNDNQYIIGTMMSTDRGVNTNPNGNHINLNRPPNNNIQNNRFTRETTTQPWFARDWDPSVFKNLDETYPPFRRTDWGDEFPVPQEGVIAPRKNDRCIESCFNRRDGDYQSCRSCRVYVSCSGGYTYDQRLCPGNLVWNDDDKICVWTSNTCH